MAQLEALPTAELLKRREMLGSRARQERTNENDRAVLQGRIESEREFLAGMDAQRERAKALPRKLRRSELERIDQTEARTEHSLARLEAELRQMPPVERTARRELAAAEQVLDERLRAAVLAARFAPPAYVTKELGERPLDPAKAKAWDRGVVAIEGYRQRHGIKDPVRALGPKCEREVQQRATLRRIRETQRVLGRESAVDRTRQLGRGLGLGR